MSLDERDRFRIDGRPDSATRILMERHGVDVRVDASGRILEIVFRVPTKHLRVPA